jgi:hypothetical protein
MPNILFTGAAGGSRGGILAGEAKENEKALARTIHRGAFGVCGILSEAFSIPGSC